jgi:hypothetical protein
MRELCGYDSSAPRDLHRPVLTPSAEAEFDMNSIDLHCRPSATCTGEVVELAVNYELVEYYAAVPRKFKVDID